MGAAILKYSDTIQNDNQETPNYNLQISKDIISSFYAPKTNKIRKKLTTQIILSTEYSHYYNPSIHIYLKIGENRLYSLKQKFSKFMSAYKHDRKFQLTPKFTYDPEEHYFQEEDKKLLDYFALHNDPTPEGEYFEQSEIQTILNHLENYNFYIEKRNKTIYCTGIKTENPFIAELSKDNNYYNLKLTNINDFTPLTPNSPYIYSDNMYKLTPKLSKLYHMMYNSEIDTITFTKKELDQFTNGILPVIKNIVKVDKNIKEIVISNTPTCKLYFDFYYNAIECKVMLTYNQREINILEQTPEIVRDNEFESNILEKLSELGFIQDQKTKHLLLENIDQIGAFLDKHINNLSQNYEVFTSKKIKETEIKKSVTARANFTIGTDNIMSYNFSLEGVEPSELENLLEQMRAKKRYYKLKNGDLIDLSSNEEIKKLNKLAEDMELSEKQIQSGEIPKYRAIYYDSLRHNRYSTIIQTNNLFDKLVERFNSYKNTEINLTKDENKILRDYQKTGVKWLYNIYKCGFGGILADEMGLGKSIQLIYLTKLIIKEKPNAKILIIAPTSLIYNWQKEFNKFGNTLKYKVFAENKEQRKNDLKTSSNINIFITTYGLVRNDKEYYENTTFDLIAIDEAQNIKNAQTQMSKVIKKLKADVKIALTGTPLENSVMELWSIFDFIMPGYLANSKRFKTLYNIKNIDEENLHKLDNLNLQINSFILRRKKEDVAKELPEKIENNIYVDLGQTQAKLYAAEVQKTKQEMDTLMKTEGFNKARFKILQLITRLRQICIDPSIVFENYTGGRAKIEQLVNLVLDIKANGRKALIFTTYKTALDIALKELTNVGVSAYYIDGSISSRKRIELVDKFNNDSTDVFLITLKAGGTGLNLTAATVVIHLDLWWNPQVENQATDRAHRIGQKNTVEVIRLIATGTIEERILELQQKKKKLAEALIEGDMRSENQFSSLTEQDIQNLLALDNQQQTT